MKHPLLLPESQAHYDDISRVPNIVQFEQENNIANAMGAISYNLIKYKNRDKGSDELDEKKRQTFLAWRELLRDLLAKGWTYDTNLRYVMLIEFPEMEYTLGEDNE